MKVFVVYCIQSTKLGKMRILYSIQGLAGLGSLTVNQRVREKHTMIEHRAARISSWICIHYW
jgi:hypothetical protein